jgi:hypothetical protein
VTCKKERFFCLGKSLLSLYLEDDPKSGVVMDPTTLSRRAFDFTVLYSHGHDRTIRDSDKNFIGSSEVSRPLLH